MTKYKLKLKEKAIINPDKYGIPPYRRGANYLAFCDDRYQFCEYESSCYNDGKAYFNRDGIYMIPKELLSKLDIIEVKERLYYIKVPNVTGYECYINEHRDRHLIVVSDKYGYSGYKTKFTKQEIEDRYPLYANDSCMIKVEDVE